MVVTVQVGAPWFARALGTLPNSTVGWVISKASVVDTRYSSHCGLRTSNWGALPCDWSQSWWLAVVSSWSIQIWVWIAQWELRNVCCSTHATFCRYSNPYVFASWVWSLPQEITFLLVSWYRLVIWHNGKSSSQKLNHRIKTGNHCFFTGQVQLSDSQTVQKPLGHLFRRNMVHLPGLQKEQLSGLRNWCFLIAWVGQLGFLQFQWKTC